MRERLRRLSVVVFAGVSIAVLGFGASVAFAGPSMDCNNPPFVVGSCLTPGFDCQAACDFWNGTGNTSGECAQPPDTQQCCFCLEV